jgi:error-prone DNA polymerase
VDLEGHPMRHLRERLRALGVEEIGALCGAPRRDGERVTAGGVVDVRQRPPTSKGFVFVGLEDTGRLDVIVPPKPYARERSIVNGSGILAVHGRLERADGVTNLRAETFFPLRLEAAS